MRDHLCPQCQQHLTRRKQDGGICRDCLRLNRAKLDTEREARTVAAAEDTPPPVPPAPHVRSTWQPWCETLFHVEGIC